VAAETGVPTQAPFWLISRSGDPESVGAKILVENGDRELDPLARRVGVGVPVGDDHARVRVRLKQRREGDGVEGGSPEIGVHADRSHAGGAKLDGTSRLREQPGTATAITTSAAARAFRRGIGKPLGGVNSERRVIDTGQAAASTATPTNLCC